MRRLFLFLQALLAVTPVGAQTTNSPGEKPISVDRLERTQMELGDGFLARSFYELALAEYRKYLEWFPSGMAVEEANYRIADCLRGMRKVAEARAQYQAVQKAFPKGTFFARASFHLAEMDLDQGRSEEAARGFHEAAARAESDSTRLASQFYEARILLQLHRQAEAGPILRELARVEKENPYRAFALLELGNMLQESGNDEEARVMFAKVLETHAAPALRAEGGTKAGAIEMQMKDWKNAASHFDQVRKLSGAEAWIPNANFQFLCACYQDNRFITVVQLATDTKVKFPDGNQADAHLLLAHSLRLLQRYKDAVASYDSFLLKYPRHESADQVAYERLICLFALNDPSWDTEASGFVKGRKPSANLANILFLQADGAFRQKRFAEASALYDKLTSGPFPPLLKPGRLADAIHTRGLALIELDQFQNAETVLADFMKHFPDDPRTPGALFQRAVCNQQLSRWIEAGALFEEFSTRFPKAPERETALYRLGLVQGQLHSYERMRAAFRQLEKDYPKTSYAADGAYWTGWSLFEEKKYSESVPSLVKSRKMDPKSFGPQATSRIILAHFKLKQLVPLIQEVDQLPADAPSLAPEIYDWMARESAKVGNPSSAERFFRKLLSLPNTPEWQQPSRWGLGTTLATQQKWQEAAAVFESYQKDYTQPADQVAAKLQLIPIYRAQKQSVRAQELCEEVMELQPEGKNNADARYQLGEILSDQQKFADAGKYFLSVAVLYNDPEMTPRSLWKASHAFESAGQTNEVQRLQLELKTKYPTFKP